VASVLLSLSIWVLIRPHVIACSQQLWLLLKRANRAFERATEYPPEMAHRLEPVARYMRLVDHVYRAVFTACAVGLAILAFVCVAGARLTWDQSLALWWTFLTTLGQSFVRLTVPALMIMVLVILLRRALASAFREWQGVKTGHE
jgi:hypothetical protein